uniref:Uncharacterized protein n=1 Tax=Lepeophtheirus salmonis TaxID=72036 RepID=A0A0K2SZM5_LEPSM
MSSLLLLQFCVLQSARELPNRDHLYLPLICTCLLCMSCNQLPKHHGQGENIGIFFFLVCPLNYIYTSAWLQISCAVNNATSGSSKVLSIVRLEMVKYRTKSSKWLYLVDNYLVSGNTVIGGSMAVLYSQSSRMKVEGRYHFQIG